MSLNYLLVFVALVLIGVLVIFLLGLRRRERLAEQDLAEQELLQELGQAPGAELPAAQAPSSRRRVMDHPFLDEELAPPLPNLPPVLLPERPGPKDVAKVRFSLGLRGYRMDQVDQVLDALATELELRGERIEQLEAELAAKAVDAPGTPGGAMRGHDG